MAKIPLFVFPLVYAGKIKTYTLEDALRELGAKMFSFTKHGEIYLINSLTIQRFDLSEHNLADILEQIATTAKTINSDGLAEGSKEIRLAKATLKHLEEIREFTSSRLEEKQNNFCAK